MSNYTRPNELDKQDEPKDWLSSALININSCILRDLKLMLLLEF
jgi:hypothetical protein